MSKTAYQSQVKKLTKNGSRGSVGLYWKCNYINYIILISRRSSSTSQTNVHPSRPLDGASIPRVIFPLTVSNKPQPPPIRTKIHFGYSFHPAQNAFSHRYLFPFFMMIMGSDGPPPPKIILIGGSGCFARTQVPVLRALSCLTNATLRHSTLHCIK